MPMKAPKEKGVSTSVLKVRQNDWLRGLNEAHASYVREITNAEHSLFIVGGYFLPGGRIRSALKQAAARGVKIKIIIAMESDVALQRNAVQFLYRWMLDKGLEIYEYVPSNVHGKVLVADNKTTIIGSYDVNNLSTFSNIELNLDIKNEPLSIAFHLELEKIAQKDCRFVTFDVLNKRMTQWRRFKYWIAYQIVKSFFALATWTARNDDNEYQ